MFKYKIILSYLLISVYVLSALHGAVDHCQDIGHNHVAHNHGHEGHDHGEDDISFIHSVTHELIHSVSHLIEHSSHKHDCCDETLMTNVNNVKNSLSFNAIIGIIENSISQDYPIINKCQTLYFPDHYKEIYLSCASQRGPPSIV